MKHDTTNIHIHTDNLATSVILIHTKHDTTNIQIQTDKLATSVILMHTNMTQLTYKYISISLLPITYNVFSQVITRRDFYH